MYASNFIKPYKFVQNNLILELNLKKTFNMKTTMYVKSLMMFVMMAMLAVTVSAQRIHKHPRITVKANKVEQKKKNANDAENVVLPTTATVMQEENIANAETEALVNEVAVATVDSKVEVNKVRRSIAKSVDVKDIKHLFNFATYSQKLTEHSRLMKVKEVQKTALEKWLLWMIILFSAAFLFTILAVIFGLALYSTAGWALATVFWILSGLCWLGGLIVLVLGLVGVI
ncbi:MAG: YccS/YhfK family membrane protein [Flavobacteriales bacterium]|nr:YccS/YhfK family membrane protein [Flavobacteriales bacterium]